MIAFSGFPLSYACFVTLHVSHRHVYRFIDSRVRVLVSFPYLSRWKYSRKKAYHGNIFTHSNIHTWAYHLTFVAWRRWTFFYMWCPGNLFSPSFAFRDALESVGLTGLARSCTCVLVKAPSLYALPDKRRARFQWQINVIVLNFYRIFIEIWRTFPKQVVVDAVCRWRWRGYAMRLRWSV